MPDTAGCSSFTEHFPIRGGSDSTQPDALCSSEIECKNICQLFGGLDYLSEKIGPGLTTQLTTRSASGEHSHLSYRRRNECRG